MQEHYPFTLKPLPYFLDSLEPVISRQTLSIHHGKHLKAYVDNLNKALAPYPDFHDWTLEKILCNIPAFPLEIQTAVKNNAGGVYNHNLYFYSMRQPNSQAPSGNLRDAITQDFLTYQNFLDEFKEYALRVFGSGYTWLVWDYHQSRPNRLRIMNTANQDVPICLGLYPIFLIDVWEHAYYLDYQNRRAEYIDGWIKLIDWNQAELRFDNCFLVER